MAHHKRRRPKNRRAGCLLCKPWKVNGAGLENFELSMKSSELWRYLDAKEQIEEFHEGYKYEEYEDE